MKFELDLLETIAYDVLDEDEIFSNVWVLSIMKNKGYFQRSNHYVQKIIKY